MAYDKEKVYADALVLSETEGYFFVQDVIDYLCIAASTFYLFFPSESEELETIKANLYKNKINEKLSLRKRLSKGSGSELIALYKLVGNDEERKSLSTNWNENNHSGDLKQIIGITFDE